MILTLLAPVAERRSRAASASLRLSNMAVIVRDIYSLLHSYRACRTAARALPPTGRQSFPVRRPWPALVLRYSGMRPLWMVGLLNLDHGEPFRAAPERSKPFERAEFFARRVESRWSAGAADALVADRRVAHLGDDAERAEGRAGGSLGAEADGDAGHHALRLVEGGADGAAQDGVLAGEAAGEGDDDRLDGEELGVEGREIGVGGHAGSMRRGGLGCAKVRRPFRPGRGRAALPSRGRAGGFGRRWRASAR